MTKLWTLWLAMLALCVVGCVSLNQSPTGDIQADITGLPEECEIDVIVTITQGDKSFEQNVHGENGKITLVPKKSLETGQDASLLFDPKAPLIITIKFITIGPGCEKKIEEIIKVDIKEGSSGSSDPIKPSSPGHWETDIRKLHF
jgi:hypothetical protein